MPKGIAFSAASLAFGAFELDLVEESLSRDGVEVPLRPKVRALLCLLAAHPGRLVPKDEILDLVWEGAIVGDEVLATAVNHLRRVLGDVRAPACYIETVHGRGYRFVAELHRSSREQVRRDAPVCVGRDSERDSLLDALSRAERGDGGVLLVTGEGGIGKSALIASFLHHASTASTPSAPGERMPGAGLRFGVGQALPEGGAEEPFLPLLDALTDLTRRTSKRELASVLRRCFPEGFVLLPGIGGTVERRSAVAPMTPSRMLRRLVDVVEELARTSTLLLVLEDLHWSDGATLAFLRTLLRRDRGAKYLVVGTMRNAGSDTRGPAKDLEAEIAAKSRSGLIHLEPLDRQGMAMLLEGRLGSPVSQELIDGVQSRSGGHPLFALALADHLLARGELARDESRWRLAADVGTIDRTVPDSVRPLLESSLSRAGGAARGLLEALAVAGLDASAADLGEVLGVEAVALPVQSVTPSFLVESSPARPGSRWRFRHVLHRDVVHENMDPDRRRALHRRWAEILLAGYSRAGTGTLAVEAAGLVALHFEKAGAPEDAIHWRIRAAERARRLAAPDQARLHLAAGLAQVALLEEARRRREMEILLQLTLGRLEFATHNLAGPSVVAVVERLLDLCEPLGDSPELLEALSASVFVELGAGLAFQAAETGRRVMAVASRLGLEGDSHKVHQLPLGCALLLGGEIDEAHAILSGVVRALDRFFGEAPPMPGAGVRLPWQGDPDIRIIARGHLALACALKNEGARVAELTGRGLAIAAAVGHPGTVATMYALSCTAQALLGDWVMVERLARSFEEATSEFGMAAWEGLAKLLRGLAIAERGRPEEGLPLAMDALAAVVDSDLVFGRPLMCILLGRAYLHVGERERAESLAAVARALIENSQLRMPCAELARLEAECSAFEPSPPTPRREARD